MSTEPLPSIVGIFDAAPVAGVEASPPSSPAAAAPDEDFGFDDGEGPPPPDDTDWPMVRRCAEEPQNDIGNSRRLRMRHGASMLHVQNIAWHVYDDRRWKEDVDGAGSRPLCHGTVEAINLEAFVMEPGEREQADLEAGVAAEEVIRSLKDAIKDLDDKDMSDTARKREKDSLRAQIKDAEPAVDRARGVLKALANRKAQRRRFANTSGNKGKIDGMIAEALPFLSHAVEELDADPLALNLRNGTLRFVQVEVPDPDCPDPNVVRLMKQWVARLDPHNRTDLISKLCECEYDPKAKCDLFDAFLKRILPDDDVREFVQRWFGYSITALTAEQAFVVFHGEGANGKSTLVDLVARILSDYATTIPIDTLVSSGGPKKGSEATPDLARLPGSRSVRAAEPKEGVAFDESLIKGLTSSEPIPIRRLNAEFIDVYPKFKLTISVNRKPPIKGDDDGIWRRVNLVPFDVQIPKDERDKRLPEKLWAERNGVLNWLIAGCLDYLERGRLDPPETVLAATQEYREESDVMAPFISGALHITKSPEDVVEAGRLYEAYQIYCRKAGTTAVQPNTFNRRMPKAATKHGFEKGKSSVSVYIGIQIKVPFTPSDAPARPHGGYSQGA